MRLIKHYCSHCYHAVRYGKWYCGWEMWDGKPLFGFTYTYYDGNFAALHLYKFYLEVHY